MVTPLARAGVAVGADGLMVEVHGRPDEALSDGAQALTLEEYLQMVKEVRAIHDVIAPMPLSRKAVAQSGGEARAEFSCALFTLKRPVRELFVPTSNFPRLISCYT